MVVDPVEVEGSGEGLLPVAGDSKKTRGKHLIVMSGYVVRT